MIAAALAMLVAIQVIAAADVAPHGADDIGTLAFHTPDEHLIAVGINGMLERGDLDYQIDVYPALYPYVSAAALLAAGARGDEAKVVRTLRLVSLSFGLLGILVMFAAARRLTGNDTLALVATALLACSPSLVEWLGRIHPDTMVVVAMTVASGALALAADGRDRRWLSAAAVAAGLGAAIKMVGFFVVPWLMVVALRIEGSRGGGSAWRGALRQVGVFALAFVAGSPPALFGGFSFWHGLGNQEGANWHGGQSTLEWPATWAGVLGWPLALAFAALALWDLGLALLAFRRGGLRALLDADGPLWRRLVLVGLVGLFALYLAVRVHIVIGRYALPLAPAVVLYAVVHAARLLASPRLPVRLGVAAALLLAVAVQARGGVDAWTGLASWSQSKDTDPRLPFRTWVLANVPADASILHTFGTYVPARNHRAERSTGLTVKSIRTQQPDFIFVSGGELERYAADPFPTPQDRREQRAHDVYLGYHDLQAGELGYVEIESARAGGIRVYRRAHGK